MKIVTILMSIIVLSGCVAGQSIKLDHEPTEDAKVSNSVSVAVNVADERSYVVNGKEPVDYIGQYRAGLGNTWNVTTKSKEPLATVFAKDIEQELQTLGFMVSDSGSDTNRSLLVTIRDWNFDMYMNGELWYEIDAQVTDQSGNELAVSRVSDRFEIAGNIWTGAKGAMEEWIPKYYDQLIDSLIRSNPGILEALEQ